MNQAWQRGPHSRALTPGRAAHRAPAPGCGRPRARRPRKHARTSHEDAARRTRDRRAHRGHVDDLRQASPAPERQRNTSDRLPHLTPPPPKPARAKMRLANGLAFWGGSDLTAPTPPSCRGATTRQRNPDGWQAKRPGGMEERRKEGLKITSPSSSSPTPSRFLFSCSRLVPVQFPASFGKAGNDKHKHWCGFRPGCSICVRRSRLKMQLLKDTPTPFVCLAPDNL